MPIISSGGTQKTFSENMWDMTFRRIMGSKQVQGQPGYPGCTIVLQEGVVDPRWVVCQ